MSRPGDRTYILGLTGRYLLVHMYLGMYADGAAVCSRPSLQRITPAVQLKARNSRPRDQLRIATYCDMIIR